MAPPCNDRHVPRSGLHRVGWAFKAMLGTVLLWSALFALLGGQIVISAPADAQDEIKAVRRAVPAAPDDSRQVMGTGDLYALVVGVSSYASKAVPKLRLSAKDAKDFAEFLSTQRRVFKKTHVKLLVDEQATKKEVEKFLYHDLRTAGKDDTVILFFSGHGSGDVRTPGKFYFLTHDSDPDYLHATAVDMSGLRFLDRLDANKAVLIADACHAGGFTSTGTKSIRPPLKEFMESFAESAGRVVLSSSKPDEYSQEKTNLANSVFTHYLLEGLRGAADINRDGIITLDEVYEYVYQRTKDETQGAQHPLKHGTVTGKFPLAVLGDLPDTVKCDVWFVAQDPRCSNPDCIDPPEGVVRCDDPLCRDISIEDGATMYLGQNYQIGLRPHATSHVYVYQIDQKGEIYRLFPGSDYLAPGNDMTNPLKGGAIYWIPGKHSWLSHGSYGGKEKVYVMASRSRNARLEDLYEHLETIGKDQKPTSDYVQARERMQEFLEKTMAPTKSIRRKVAPTPSKTVTYDKNTSFEYLSQTIESATLDTARSVWFWVTKK
ncbi:MAG: caspase family protein [Desulfomonilaceae bacterium]|nr:caspase family protein [Desulfomonilaceae bacterium]